VRERLWAPRASHGRLAVGRLTGVDVLIARENGHDSRLMVLSQDGWAGCVAGPVGEGDGVAVDTADTDTRLLSVAVLPVPPDDDAAPADAIVAEAGR
jgi:hypothetical protein